MFKFDADLEKVEVDDENKCIRCGECTRLGVQDWKCLVDNNIVEVGFIKETYIFSVEVGPACTPQYCLDFSSLIVHLHVSAIVWQSNGQLEPENIVLCALEILQNKLYDLYSQDDGGAGTESDAAPMTPASSDYSTQLSGSDGSESEGVTNDWGAVAADSSTFD